MIGNIVSRVTSMLTGNQNEHILSKRDITRSNLHDKYSIQAVMVEYEMTSKISWLQWIIMKVAEADTIISDAIEGKQVRRSIIKVDEIQTEINLIKLDEITKKIRDKNDSNSVNKLSKIGGLAAK